MKLKVVVFLGDKLIEMRTAPTYSYIFPIKGANQDYQIIKLEVGTFDLCGRWILTLS